MKPYELTYIISSHLTSEEADGLRKGIESLVQASNGIITKSEKTTPQVLAYPIKGQHSGFFAILEFTIEEDKIKEIKAALEKDAKILRHFLMVKKPVKQMKERRTRKTPVTLEARTKETLGNIEVMKEKEKHKEEKVEIEDIEKKLDEILSE